MRHALTHPHHLVYAPPYQSRNLNLHPEATILIINAALLAFAYLWAYPSLPEKTANAIMWRDAVISIAALVLAAALFASRGITFNMFVFDTNWFVFSLVSMMLMEIPLFIWFARKYDLRFDDADDT
jgi:hypothetical protein